MKTQTSTTLQLHPFILSKINKAAKANNFTKIQKNKLFIFIKLIDTLHYTNFHTLESGYFQIHTILFKKIIGNDYKTYLNILIDLEIVLRQEYYSADKNITKHIKLAKEYINLDTSERYQILNSDYAITIKIKMNDIEFIHWNIKDYNLKEKPKKNEVTFQGDITKWLKDQLITSSNLLYGQYLYGNNKLSENTGRLTTRITNLPNTEFAKLCEDNDLVEIDASAFHPNIIKMHLNDYDTNDIRLFKELVANNTIYQYIGEQLNIDDYHKVKRLFAITLGSLRNKKRYGDVIKIIALFPNVFKSVNHLMYINGKFTAASLLQRFESDIFIKRFRYLLYEANIPVDSKHDSIICKKSDLDRVKSIMEEELQLINYNGGLHVTIYKSEPVIALYNSKIDNIFNVSTFKYTEDYADSITQSRNIIKRINEIAKEKDIDYIISNDFIISSDPNLFIKEFSSTFGLFTKYNGNLYKKEVYDEGVEIPERSRIVGYKIK